MIDIKNVLMFIVLNSVIAISFAAPAMLDWPHMYVQQTKKSNKQRGSTARMHIATKVKIVCETLPIHFLTRKDLVILMKQKNASRMSPRGSYTFLADKQQISICDDTAHLRRLLVFLRNEDRVPVQIKMRARIISVDQQFVHDLGLTILSSQTNETQHSDGINFVLASFKNQIMLNANIHALLSAGHAKVISQPSLLTSNGKLANIESGEEVPYQQNSLSGATSVAFKKAVMQLSVMPQLVGHNKVALRVSVHQDKVTPASVNGVPIISTEQIKTSAIVGNHQTLVIGGIIETTQSHQQVGVPLLQRLPLLGALFRRNKIQRLTKQLLIFITPSWSVVR